MRIDMPASGEFIQTLTRTPDAAVKCNATTALTLPRISQKVPANYAAQGDLTTAGYLGQWMIETGNLTAQDWNPENPVESINKAFDALLADAMGKDCQIDMHIIIARRESLVYAPECVDVNCLTAPVFLAIESSDTEPFSVPFLKRLATTNPKIAKGLMGLIEDAMDATLRCFSGNMATYTAHYAYYMGEISGTEASLEKDDKIVQEFIESGDISEDTPLPSQFAKAIPICFQGASKAPLTGLDDVLAHKPEVIAAVKQLKASFKKLAKQSKKLNAWSICGEYNYDTAPAVMVSIAEHDEIDMISDMFDIYTNDQMSAGNGCDMKGLTEINNAEEFALWLESVKMGCKVIQQTIELIKALKND